MTPYTLKGMLFQEDMIRALLNTEMNSWPAKAIDESKPFKWQTRRIIKPQPTSPLAGWPDATSCINIMDVQNNTEYYGKCGHIPYPVGMIIYAREAWRTYKQLNKLSPSQVSVDTPIRYEAGENKNNLGENLGKYRHARFMCVWMARLWLKVVRVRVEKVNEISEDDSIAEGVNRGTDPLVSARYAYGQLYNSINGQGSFESGQYVWVYDLMRVRRPHNL